MVTLPPLIVEKRNAVGQIRHLLRPEVQVDVVERTVIRISPRIEQPLWVLSNGERIVVTSRRGVAIPPGADGVLLDLGGDRYEWAVHAKLTEFTEDVNRVGWGVTAERISETWRGRLAFRAERREPDGSVPRGQEGLRPPQLGALHAIGAHWSLSNQPATVVMPTGTGKTETMLATLAAYPSTPILVVVPWDLLRKQTAEKFLRFGLLRKLGVLPENASNPIVGIVTKRLIAGADLSIFSSCNVIIATVQTIGVDPAVLAEVARQTSTLILDEAHHVAATSWTRVKDAFCGLRTLQFTATPFRRDGQLVDGKVIFNYPLGDAQRDGYFKPIKFEPVYEVGGTRADQAIARTAIAKLREDLQNGLDHLLMARCGNIGRAQAVEQIYRAIAPDLNPVLIHSEAAEASARVEALRAGRARIVICVDMLGEGFDLPKLKIAAIHDMHRSLAILLQFVGRFTRVAGAEIGDATVVANIADPNAAIALERLYSEDADWNKVLSELSSDAARDHAELVAFLQASQRLHGDDDSAVTISQQLLRPVFSTAVFRVALFVPERFHEGLGRDRHVHAVWVHRESKTLYFVTRSEPRVKWTQAKGVRDREWALFVLHYDAEQGLLYLSSTDHSSLFVELAEAVSGEAQLISGDEIFRALGGITRLIFQSIGVKKHGRRNLSYAMYTGADVAQALGLAERQGSVKNNVSGTGWEGGGRVAIGCSYKGRVWSREQGTVPAFVKWCKTVGTKLLNNAIDVRDIIANVLIPDEVDALPDKQVLSVEWPAELIGVAEERVVLSAGENEWPLFLVELDFIETNGNEVRFALRTVDNDALATFALVVGGARGFDVNQVDGHDIHIAVGRNTQLLSTYLGGFPPLVRFVDLSELDGNLLIHPQDPRHLEIADARFEVWDWQGVDITKESMWKDGAIRQDSIQWKAANHYTAGGFDVVFDDDGAGEAADLVCLKEEADRIRLALVHCKFAGGRAAGERVKDIVEVCSQAVRSAKWKWRFADLGKHVLRREEKLANPARATRFVAGDIGTLNAILKASRFKPVEAEVLVVQPGLSFAARTPDQKMVLAAAMTYLKETIGCDMDVICSD